MIDYDKLWAEIDKIVDEEYSKKKSYERTVAEFSALWKIGEEKTKAAIERLEASGKLLSRMAVCSNGRYTKVYYPAEYKTK